MAGKANGSRWMEGLSDEDLMFIKRFVLASGSLKALAENYGVSYPTIRLRLDRLIEKIKVLDDSEIQDEFERRVRALFADGKIPADAMKELLTAYRKELEREEKS